MEITRFGPPNEFDQFPKGTICIVDHDRYKQISEDEQHPKWELVEEYN